MASPKLDALVDIVWHHISSDNTPPLHVINGQKLEPDLEYMLPSQPEGLHSNKIVIYSEFPSSNPQIISVSDTTLLIYGDIFSLHLNRY